MFGAQEGTFCPSTSSMWLLVIFRGHHPRFRWRAIPLLLLEHPLRFFALETSTDQYRVNHLVKQYY
jgi:hypothetical protein